MAREGLWIDGELGVKRFTAQKYNYQLIPSPSPLLSGDTTIILLFTGNSGPFQHNAGCRKSRYLGLQRQATARW